MSENVAHIEHMSNAGRCFSVILYHLIGLAERSLWTISVEAYSGTWANLKFGYVCMRCIDVFRTMRGSHLW